MGVDILDTNVISELMLGDTANRAVVRWIRGLSEQPTTTVINRAEILAGIALVPAGRRRDGMLRDAEAAFAALGGLLPLGADCAPTFADIVAQRRAAGRPVDPMDGLIAAIALRADAGVATRNTADFEGVGLRLIDPWSEADGA